MSKEIINMNSSTSKKPGKGSVGADTSGKGSVGADTSGKETAKNTTSENGSTNGSNGKKKGKETLRSQIRMLIQKRIRDGEYKPGERIVETRLCKELSVSQAPVREAVLELSMMGLLEEKAYLGTFVRDVKPEEIADFFNIRAFVEEYAARRACSYCTEENLAEMREIMHKMDECTCMDEFVEIDSAFHEAMMRASGSKALVRCWNTLQISEWTYESILATNQTLDELRASHWRILELIETGQDYTAGAYVFLHIRGFCEEITRRIDQKQAEMN